jgi:hypothetical protein
LTPSYLDAGYTNEEDSSISVVALADRPRNIVSWHKRWKHWTLDTWLVLGIVAGITKLGAQVGEQVAKNMKLK